MLPRACITTIASYIFVCRGKYGACAMREDLVINTTHITLRLRKEKGKNPLKEGHKNTKQILIDDMPRATTIMQVFFSHTEKTNKKCQCRWATMMKEEKCVWSATTST